MLLRSLALVLFVAFAAKLLLTSAGSGRAAEPSPKAEAIGALIAGQLAGLAVPMPKPEPGDWLAEHRELGQSFQQYVASKPPLPTPERSVLYVAPLGPFSEAEEELLAASCVFLGLYFDLPVKRLAAVLLDGLPSKAKRSPGRGFGPQVNSEWILERELVPRLPDDGAALIGLTATDLWPGRGWNFVFGQANLEKRVGVWSLARYGDPAESDAARALALQRALAVASHETGHMFGLRHCIAWSCNMNGSNHLEESDSQPLHLCPECTAKVVWATGVDAAQRAERLGAFASEYGLPAQESSYWAAASKRLSIR